MPLRQPAPERNADDRTNCSCGRCRYCRLEAVRPGYAARFPRVRPGVVGFVPPAAPPPTRAVPCVHLGTARVLPPAAPDTVRDWRHCEHPDRPHGVVCGCRQCQACADYAPDE